MFITQVYNLEDNWRVQHQDWTSLPGMFLHHSLTLSLSHSLTHPGRHVPHQWLPLPRLWQDIPRHVPGRAARPYLRVRRRALVVRGELTLPQPVSARVALCTVLYCTVLYCTVLYCTVLYCTVLYCTVLYCHEFVNIGNFIHLLVYLSLTLLIH
jgi:hypothetical protein